MQAIPNFIIFLSLLYFTNSHFFLAESITIKNERDYEALLAIKAEISDDPHSILSSWNNSLPLCQWEGVTCGRRHPRVVSLDLSYGDFVGTLSPFIGNLSFLLALNLTHNLFQGGIPHQISYLLRLQSLDLTNNLFGGEIPANLSHCLNLQILQLTENELEWRIPRELTTLPNIVDFSVAFNNLSGRLQDIGIGNMSSSLKILNVAYNQLQGSIPHDIGRLQGVVYLLLGNNLLSGTIPPSLFNLSSLNELALGNTQIHGHLPQDLGLRLPRLQYLYIGNMSLSGQVPTSSNLSQIMFLEIAFNFFEGDFSLNGNNLPLLTHLNIGFAFSETGPNSLGFLDTLSNCTNLGSLLMEGNSFTGAFPRSILNLSTSLVMLDLSGNQLSRQIPLGLGKFGNLHYLDLRGNSFTGLIPADVGELKRMVSLYFGSNRFSGGIPFSLGNLSYLSELSMEYNDLEGSLPTSLGNCRNLQKLSLYSNKLSGVLPVELFHASSLISIRINQNELQGSFPVEINNLTNLFELDGSDNRFTGEIPNTLGGCTSLTILNMSRNSLVGSIPGSLGPLKSIQKLDFSYNNLSGQIPSYFSSWPYLSNLNLSFNNLEGEVPTNKVFANISVVSVVGNNKLCGGVVELHLQRCPSPKVSKRRRLSLALIMIISIACTLIVVISIALCFYLFCSERRRHDTSSESHNIKPFLEVSHQMLSRATNGFSSSNLIGVGGFGSVYKGILHQDDVELVVAVKVMKLQNEGASKSFLVECKALRSIRHRNLVKIITACSSIDTQRNDFKALIYEFMPRGSLEEWLYPNRSTDEHVGDDQAGRLSLFQRLNIAIDMASALEYLHIGCANPIIHCDLKPSNILLDDDMTAHIGDFGLAKFKFRSGASTSSNTDSTQVRGTVGYAPPGDFIKTG